jgi:hypothetical protein
VEVRVLERDLTADSLWARIPRIALSDVGELLGHPVLAERHVVKLLLRPDLPEPILAELARSAWAGNARVQFGLVNHPKTPLADALNLVKFLMWRDLNHTVLNFRIASEVRHAAEATLIQRMPSMAVGERITLGRLAGGQVLKSLRAETEPRVAEALLENSRLVEEDVLFIINRPRTIAPILESIAMSAKWSTRNEVRIALLRNPKTPLSVAAPFISQMTVGDIQPLADDPKVPLALRRMIETRLGKSG